MSQRAGESVPECVCVCVWMRESGRKLWRLAAFALSCVVNLRRESAQPFGAQNSKSVGKTRLKNLKKYKLIPAFYKKLLKIFFNPIYLISLPFSFTLNPFKHFYNIFPYSNDTSLRRISLSRTLSLAQLCLALSLLPLPLFAWKSVA